MIEKDITYNECCMDTMAKMPDAFLDLTITSPPYDNMRNYNGYSFPFEDVVRELYRVTKKGGIVVWIINDQTVKGSESGTSFRQALFFMANKWKLHDTMIYKKINPTPNSGTRYQQSFEYMFVFSKGKPKTSNIKLVPRRNKHNDKRKYRNKNFTRNIDGEFKKSEFHFAENVPRSNVWEYSIGGNNTTTDKEAFEHPAIFHEKMVEDHILSWSNVGDIIYDPCAGSGTTQKMSILNNRHYIASEISETYCDIIKRRLSRVI
jgi:DNA modification methylase